MAPPPDIYQYLDFRRYLKDYYENHKARNPAFSYGSFSRLAGIKSKGLLHDILSGRKSLSKGSAFRLAEAMKLDEKAFAYFQTLVDYGQTEDLKEKSYFFRKLREGSPASPLRKLRDDGYEFYSQWYYHTLRELMPLIRFNGDFETLGRMLDPPISAAKAKKGLQLLLRLGLLEKTRTGYQQSDRLISSGEGVEAMALRDFHLQNLELAVRSIDEIPRRDRDLSCVVMALSKTGFARVGKEMEDFRKRLLRISEEETKPTAVYHIDLLTFPTASTKLGTEPGLP
jgi:uncharacterized protein (TIGR02147 family)